MTLLDHLPSLRRAAGQRISPDHWPLNTRVDELGRLCVSGVALTDLAAEFGTPAHVLDEADLRKRLRSHRASTGELVPVLAARSVPTTVMRWIDDEGIGLVIRSGADLAAARSARVEPARMILHARGLSHDDLVLGASFEPGRIVVESTTDVAYLCGRTARRRRVLVGATGGSPDPVVVERVLHEPGLELVGFHCRADDDVEGSVGTMLSAMRALRRNHGRFLTEVHLTVDAPPSVIDDALDAACAATRWARPRLVIESRCPSTALDGIGVYRVTSVISPPDAARIVVVDGQTGTGPHGVVALANRHPLSATQEMTVISGDRDDDLIGRDILLPSDIHAGDVLAVAGSRAADGAPTIAVRDGETTALTRRMRIDETLSRDLGYSAGGGNDQDLGRLHADGHALARGEFPG